MDLPLSVLAEFQRQGRLVNDLADGVESKESPVVSLAAPRLRREGVPVPSECFRSPFAGAENPSSRVRA